MKLFFFFVSALLLISKVNSGLTEEQRKALLKKVTKAVSFSSRSQPLNQFYSRNDEKKMTYEASKIKEIIDKYSFPETYNFIDAESTTVHINDQATCGGCWAFASTTALAYRFKKKGVDNLLWCLVGDGVERNYIEKRIIKLGLQKDFLFCTCNSRLFSNFAADLQKSGKLPCTK